MMGAIGMKSSAIMASRATESAMIPRKQLTALSAPRLYHWMTLGIAHLLDSYDIEQVGDIRGDLCNLQSHFVGRLLLHKRFVDGHQQISVLDLI